MGNKPGKRGRGRTQGGRGRGGHRNRNTTRYDGNDMERPESAIDEENAQDAEVESIQNTIPMPIAMISITVIPNAAAGRSSPERDLSNP